MSFDIDKWQKHFSGMPAALQAIPSHEHSWFVTCRCDANGLTVLDCACGERKRTRQGTNGAEEVHIPPGPMGDILFDLGQVA